MMMTIEPAQVDLAAVAADAALLNTLGRADVVRAGADAELVWVLVVWRRAVDTEPVGQLVDLDTAVAVIAAAVRLRVVVLGCTVAMVVLAVGFWLVGLLVVGGWLR